MPDKKTIGERLRNLMNENKKKQKDVATVLSVTENTISYFVNGKRSPNIEQLCTLAEYFDTTTDYLLGRADARTNNQEIRSICDYTGLSEESVKNLHSLSSFEYYNVIINSVIEVVSNELSDHLNR